jgi:cysteine desulfuration protein SufE
VMEQASTIAEEAALIEEDFALFEDARDKIEYLIDLGKGLPALDDRHKTEANKVRGCQSQVWMVAELDPESGRLHFEADSDAILVRGLIAMLMRLYDQRRPEEILDNPPEIFQRVGLGRMLTPGRSNGLYSMVGRMRQFAEGFKEARVVAAP